MRKTFSILLLVFTMVGSFAQEKLQVEKDTTNWLKELRGGLNFNQASFSGNWKGGGVNSVALGMYLAGRANYAKGKWTWDNTMDFIYGIVKNQGESSRKSNDRMFLDSKLGYSFDSKWNYFFGVNFLSQFTAGYDFGGNEKVLISKFMSPGFLTTAIGVEYKPNPEFALRLSPFSPRWTFVTDTKLYQQIPDNYGVEIGKKLRQEWLAFSLMADWNKNLAENLKLLVRYQAYANYETMAWKTIDHRLDLGLTAKVTSLINVSLTSLSLYDIDQDEKIQFSQGLALGIAFKRGNFPEKK
jgi:hypothetical protein